MPVKAVQRKPLIVGINGAQGCGKSTMCIFLEVLLQRRGLRTVTLALDDFYLPRTDRERLASEVHPLFMTRGVPGTHTIGEAKQVIEDILAGRSTALPVFDKAADDRTAEKVAINGPVDVLLFEGWCVGALPQSESALGQPVNQLEAEEDPTGLWRGLVNRFLQEDYAAVFGLLDQLIMLKAESFYDVIANRKHQEAKLRILRPDAPALMDDPAIERFCAHYERLTKHMMAEMPPRADVLFHIGKNQMPSALPAILRPQNP